MIRTLRIGFRTLHIGAMGLLLGGLAFDISPERLEVSFWVTVGSGVALVLVESGARWLWFHQLSGVMTLTKVALFVAVRFSPFLREVISGARLEELETNLVAATDTSR